VTGSVFSTFTDWTIQADIHSGPAGQNPTGTFSESFHFGSGTNDFHIGDTTVTCLVVQGNQAVAVGTGTFGGGFNFETGEPNPDVQGWFRLYVQDNGPPRNLPPIFPTSDVVNSSFSEAEPDCVIPAVPPPPSIFPDDTVGNFIVHDAPALPTSKDQCKNGGWRQYGVFKNQGDCVSFVATGGRNQPAGPPR
jgi:hypothetical protein